MIYSVANTLTFGRYNNNSGRLEPKGRRKKNIFSDMSPPDFADKEGVLYRFFFRAYPVYGHVRKK